MDPRLPGFPPPDRRPAWTVAWWQAVAALAAVVAAALLAGPPAAAAVGAGAALALALLAQLRARSGGVPVYGDAQGPAAGEAPPPPPATDAAPAPPPPDADALVLRYRPLRSLPELHLRGVEAELRWAHPLEGLRVPADWPQPLPPTLAAALLDAWIGPALAQFALWLPTLRARGGATLWLRLPAPLLAVPDLPQRLSAALAAHGLDPSVVVLRLPLRVQGRRAELPEPAAALHAMGVTLAVDGFGAGSASLTHLDHLPVRTVCLAPSFVARAGPATPQRWVVESTARLAQSLGMGTLAEGVEQESQVLALAAMGCDLGVGDVCGPWLEASDWERRWAAGRSAQAA